MNNGKRQGKLSDRMRRFPPKRCRLGTGGMTMVEVMVAFVVLLLIMGMFSQAMGLAQSMAECSNRTLEEKRQLAGDYYQAGEDSLETAAGSGSTWVFEGNGNSESFSVQARLYAYSETAADGSDMGTIYELAPTEAESESAGE